MFITRLVKTLYSKLWSFMRKYQKTNLKRNNRTVTRTNQIRRRMKKTRKMKQILSLIHSIVKWNQFEWRRMVQWSSQSHSFHLNLEFINAMLYSVMRMLEKCNIQSLEDVNFQMQWKHSDKTFWLIKSNHLKLHSLSEILRLIKQKHWFQIEQTIKVREVQEERLKVHNNTLILKSQILTLVGLIQ